MNNTNKMLRITFIIVIGFAVLSIIACQDGNDQGNTPIITWTYTNTPFSYTNTPFDSNAIRDITYGAGKFVAVGDCGKMAYSMDGITWIAVTNSPFSDLEDVRAITYGGSKFVAVGINSYSISSSNKSAYSTDGITWTESGYMSAFTGVVYDITYGGGKFVAVGHDTAYSVDGQTWMAASNNFFNPYGLIECVAYGNGKFVAGGNNGNAKGKIAYSTNGETWIAVTDSIFDNIGVIDNIAYGNGKFVALGGIVYSDDGVTWTEADTRGSFGIVYGGGKFYSLDREKIKYSVNGVNWTEIAADDILGGYAIYAFTYGGGVGSGRLMLGTVGGGIYYSDVLE